MEKPEVMKRCTKCGEWFPATPEYFFRWNKGKDGLKTICKACHREDVKRYRKTMTDEQKAARQKYDQQYRIENRASILKMRQVKREAQTAEQAEQAKEYRRAYRKANKERRAQYKRDVKARTFLFDMLTITKHIRKELIT